MTAVETAAAVETLTAHDIPVEERHERVVASDSTGSVVVLDDAGESIAGFDAFGQRGTPAEEVGLSAARQAIAHADGTATVDRYLGDQLLVVLALAGGRIRVPRSTDHVTSSVDLLEQLGYAIELTPATDDSVVLSSSRPEDDPLA